MGVRILYDEKGRQACLYCSTSGWAFGPIFHDDDSGREGRERAETFVRWLTTWTPAPEDLNALGRLRGWRGDARELEDRGLERAFGQWLSEEHAKVAS